MCFWLVILLFKIAPEPVPRLFSSDPKCKKAVLCFMLKICVSDKLHEGMSYSAVGYEFHVNESTIYIK